MILVTTETISGKTLETLGLVKGSTIQSAHIGRDIGSAFKTLVGGELQSYNEMLNKARALATERMVREARELDVVAHVVQAEHLGEALRRVGLALVHEGLGHLAQVDVEQALDELVVLGAEVLELDRCTGNSLQVRGPKALILSAKIQVAF